MFCSKCGTDAMDAKVCPSCGMEVSGISNLSSNNVTTSISEFKKTLTIQKIVFIGLAALILILFFVAAGMIAKGGKGMVGIKSVGGKTLEEAYYAEMGHIYAGFALISRTMGIFFASVLVWLGFKK